MGHQGFCGQAHRVKGVDNGDGHGDTMKVFTKKIDEEERNEH